LIQIQEKRYHLHHLKKAHKKKKETVSHVKTEKEKRKEYERQISLLRLPKFKKFLFETLNNNNFVLNNTIKDDDLILIFELFLMIPRLEEKRDFLKNVRRS